jgi:hypothetical protein
MPFRNFDFCILCEGVRPEVGGKLTVLGFFGVAPSVEIVVQNPNQPLMMSFIAGFPPVTGGTTVYQNVISLIRPNGAPVFQTPPAQLNVSTTSRGLVATAFVIPPPYVWGRHVLRIYVNNELKLDTSFNIRQANPAELASIAGLPFSPPIGAPN